MMKVYTASKLSKIGLWRSLARQWGEDYHFHARWYAQVDNGTKETPENARVFWVEDAEDVAASDVVLVYGVGDEHLQGTLVEAGMAIALGIPVIVIGDYNYGNWVYHPGVKRAKYFEDVWAELETLRFVNLTAAPQCLIA